MSPSLPDKISNEEIAALDSLIGENSNSATLGDITLENRLTLYDGGLVFDVSVANLCYDGKQLKANLYLECYRGSKDERKPEDQTLWQVETVDTPILYDGDSLKGEERKYHHREAICTGEARDMDEQFLDKLLGPVELRIKYIDCLFRRPAIVVVSGDLDTDDCRTEYTTLLADNGL